MIKETALFLYLLLVRTLFSLCRCFSIQNKTVLLTSFGDNMQHVVNELERSTDSKVIILKEPRCSFRFQFQKQHVTLSFSPSSPVHFIRGIYHLATSRVVFVDNYHVVLAGCRFHKSVTCVQLWHANGAVKLFGLKDKSISGRTHSARRRFLAVYKNFHKLTVSSDDMASIFKEAFDKTDDSILRTGVPRTDFYFDEEKVSASRDAVRRKLSQPGDKTLLLYAPTYRAEELNVESVNLDIFKLKEQLGDNYHLLIRMHPAVNLSAVSDDAFVTNVSRGYQIEELLAASDVLITDYSSTPFEFSILNKPMLFYPYDLASYEEKTGIWFDYEKNVPGNIAMTTGDLIRMIQTEDYHFHKVKSFNDRWNKYADGHSTERLINTLYR